MVQLLRGVYQRFDATVPPVLKSGKVRALAVTSARRSGAAPEYPTIAESGLPGYEAESCYALFAAGSPPREVVNRLSVETLRVLAMPEVRDALANQGAEPVADTPEVFAAIVRADVAKWAKIVKQTGATAD